MRRFTACSGCGHRAVTRGGACGLCGAPTAEAAPPADLFTGWRCDCYHCVETPC